MSTLRSVDKEGSSFPKLRDCSSKDLRSPFLRKQESRNFKPPTGCRLLPVRLEFTAGIAQLRPLKQFQGTGGHKPIPDCEIYCKMLDKAKENHFAYPAINVSPSPRPTPFWKGLAAILTTRIVHNPPGKPIPFQGGKPSIPLT